ncbi:hypothetical protein CEXT_94891 [Caerostris extrusa]|uniref:Uncharacterized protein n=1 Tax=Caerostris extrusa TaxID=172846 RepID=A0AAV4PW34_CAEEX|nr:hypothetical protein CEXT_94891 [Caerostris extrusa]
MTPETDYEKGSFASVTAIGCLEGVVLTVALCAVGSLWSGPLAVDGCPPAERGWTERNWTLENVEIAEVQFTKNLQSNLAFKFGFHF